MSDVTYCLHCGATRTGDEPFCGTCGSNIEVMEMAPRQLECPSCHNAVGVTWSHCGACGNSLAAGGVRPLLRAVGEAPPPPPSTPEIEPTPRVHLISQPRDILDVVDLNKDRVVTAEPVAPSARIDEALHTSIAEMKGGYEATDDVAGYLTAGPVGQWAQLALVAFGLVAVLTVGGLLLLNIRLDSFRDGSGTLESAEQVRDVLNLWLRPLAVGFGALAFGLVVAWAYRVHENIEAFGITGRRIPGWLAIASWFIPIANLLVPHRVVNDAWRGSHHEATGRNWTSYRRNRWVDVWWLAAIAAIAAAVLSFLAGNDTTAASMDGNTWLALGYGLLVLMVLAAVRTIETVNRRQRTRASR
ncbi:MAG: DUF4328 domain-containing protein [Acidimicrobiia bacterium]|nr:DUF4328 domain-containing protein [Acidimicrobiia bacterium]NNC75889.1 DUF4328 domain-containing protein [Acidimicrobiia bacterium]